MSGKRRVTIRWTATALAKLKELPVKVRAGLLAKADGLYACSDPRSFGKPLTGPLQGYYRIVYSRYRAIYSVHEETLATGEVRVDVKITFVAAGIRRQHSKEDIYRVVQRLVKLGLTVIPEDGGDPPTIAS